RIAADPQTWHQEFKRGPAPREEHVLALVGAEGSLQVKPALLRSLPFGDGHEYRRARLGSEKIVVVLAQPALGLLKPDRKLFLLSVVQNAKIHFIGHGLSGGSKCSQAHY